jgi:glutathione S-transferase
MDRVELWQFTNSHYNEKARWALDFKRIPHERHTLIPGFHFRKIKRLTGQTTVPVLVLDGEAVFDSTRIIERLERLRPDPPLYPADPGERRRALALEEFFDEELGPHIRRAAFHAILPFPDYVVGFFAGEAGLAQRVAFRAALSALRPLIARTLTIDDTTAALGRRKTAEALDRLESELGPSGYLVGDRFTVADLTAAALFAPLVRPREFPYRVPEPPPEPVQRWRDSLAQRRGWQWVLDVYARHRGPSAEIRAVESEPSRASEGLR